MTEARGPSNEGSGKTSVTLLARLRGHDAEAWRRFVHLYGPIVYCWCRKAGLRENDAADVGQEVFLAVSRAIGTFQYGRTHDSFRGWLRTITRNKVRDFFRQVPGEGDGVGGSEAQTRLYQAAATAEEESDDDAAAAEERSLILRRAAEAILVGCKPETREAFLRVVLDRQAPADVARDMGLSLNAVYLIKSRTLRQFREEYADLIDLD